MIETFITKFITKICCCLLLVLVMPIQIGVFCLSENNFASLSSSTANYLNGKHFRFTSVQVLNMKKKLTINLLIVNGMCMLCI